VEDLKLDLIRQVEQRVDLLRKEEERLNTQLAEIEPQLEEARAMLQLIKTGKAHTPAPKRRTMTKREDAEEALKLLTGEFSSAEYAELLDMNMASAGRWLNMFEANGLIYKVRDSQITTNGRIPTIWKVK
jgi:hypothetical protein